MHGPDRWRGRRGSGVWRGLKRPIRFTEESGKGEHMPAQTWELILSVMAGIALAAACGFRVFVPLFVASIAVHANVLSVAPQFSWVGTTPAMVALGVACVLEITAYYVPWLDHMLDTIAAPTAVIAGALAAVAVMSNTSPWVAWVLGVVAGGGAAALVQGTTMLTRGVSLVTTGGLGNPIVATAEGVLAVIAAVLAVLAPVFALFMVALIGVVFWRMWNRRQRDAKQRLRAEVLPA
jgi:hypothetical protein